MAVSPSNCTLSLLSESESWVQEENHLQMGPRARSCEMPFAPSPLWFWTHVFQPRGTLGHILGFDTHPSERQHPTLKVLSSSWHCV